MNLKMLLLAFLMCLNGMQWSAAQVKERDYKANKKNLKKMEGNSIQIDPLVLYSMNISPDSLVKDLKKAKITSVHFVVVNKWDGRKDDSLFKPAYLTALRKNNIAIWLMLPGNCMYDQLSKEWEMEFLKPFAEENLRFYSFHKDEYVRWQEERIERIFSNYHFEGIGFAESYFPEWNTIYTNGHYGDISFFAREKFCKEYLNVSDEILSFEAIMNNPEYFTKWQEFRSEAILSFNHRMKEAVRKVSPKTVFASWIIAVLGGSSEEIKQHYGLDLVRIAKDVNPDIIFIQTSYLEWGNPSLPYDYITGYDYAKSTIESANPNMKIGIQADIASLSFHNPGVGVRVPKWWLDFMKFSKKLGYYTSTSYEYAFSKKQGLWIE